MFDEAYVGNKNNSEMANFSVILKSELLRLRRVN